MLNPEVLSITDRVKLFMNSLNSREKISVGMYDLLHGNETAAKKEEKMNKVNNPGSKAEDLINRYVYAVGRLLPMKNRKEIEAEIKSYF